MASLETLHKTYQVSTDNLKPNIKHTEYQTILETNIKHTEYQTILETKHKTVTQYLYRLHPENKMKHSFQTYNKKKKLIPRYHNQCQDGVPRIPYPPKPPQSNIPNHL